MTDTSVTAKRRILKLSELSDIWIDYLVARFVDMDAYLSTSLGETFAVIGTGDDGKPDWVRYSPSSRWHHAGPIIHAFKICIIPSLEDEKKTWMASVGGIDPDLSVIDHHPLRAAMKAFIPVSYTHLTLPTKRIV